MKFLLQTGQGNFSIKKKSPYTTDLYQLYFSSPKVKVENFLEDSLDSIQSLLPSVKIQIIGGKVYLR